MANIHRLSDTKKGIDPLPTPGEQEGSGGNPPGGLGTMFGSMFGGGHSANEGNVQHFTGNKKDFGAELNNAGGRLVVVDFWATW